MRIFVFAFLFFAGAGLAGAQPVPDLGPEVEPPSAEDFNALPDDLPEEGGQVVEDQYLSADIATTIYMKLGIPHDLIAQSPDGRPVRLIEGKPIAEWF